MLSNISINNVAPPARRRHLGSAADLQKPGDRAASNGRDARGHGERESLLRPLLERGAGNGQGGDAPSTSEAPQR